MSDQAPPAASFEVVLLDEVLAFVDPVRNAASSPLALAELLAVLGWNAGAIGLSVTAISDVEDAATRIEAIIDQLTAPDPEITLDTLINSLVATEELVQAVTAVEALAQSAPPDFAGFGADLLELLTTSWLRRRHPTVFKAMTLLTLVTPADRQDPSSLSDAVQDAHGVAISFPVARDTLNFDRIGKLLTDPAGTLSEIYIPAGATGPAYAQGLADNLLPVAGELLQHLGAQTLYGTYAAGDTNAAALLGAQGAVVAAHALSFWFRFGGDDSGSATDLSAGAGASVMFQPTGQSATATTIEVGVAPSGEIDFHTTIGPWMADLDLQGHTPAVFFSPRGVRFADTTASLSARAKLTKLSAGPGPVVLIGSNDATRLEIGALSLELDAAIDSAPAYDLGFIARAQHALVAVSGGDGDGFLAKVLPSPGLLIPFDLGVGWSKTKGLYFDGGVTIKVDLPLNLSLFDVIEIEEIELAVTPVLSGTPAVKIDTGVTVGVTIGPFAAEIDKVGLSANMTFPPGGGNVGPMDLTLGFKPPTGAGLSLDAGVVNGGGYLSFDPPEYAGILDLEALDTIAIKAIGLISTVLPSGQPGFSLLLIITAEFPPIQLGYGFTLNGVGGMIGANRTMAMDVLRADLHSGGLESILFPPDPVAHAHEVISNLREGFPVAEGRFVLGPMAKLGWGTPSLISLSLGLIVELPMPLRIALLGRLAIALPDPDDAVVLLQLDILGLLDFGTGDISFDATLHDSRVTEFPITGDMALRANVGAHPDFAMSAGGFHPSFPAPANFPKMERLGISLGDSDNPRVRLEAYMALTTNTVQTGAHVDIFASLDTGIAGTFSISAQLGFDAILHFSPFAFAADFGASVDLKHNGDSIASIYLELHLTAPTPWHAWGKATIQFFGSHEFDVSVTAGSLPPAPPPAAINVLTDKLMVDLAAPASWAASMPDEGHMLVTLLGAPDDGTTIRVHPLGSLTVHERSVPLDLTIDRFGTSPIAGARRFSIATATIGGGPADVTPITDRFAPGQFLALSDDQLLARPAFELLGAGAAIAPRNVKSQSASQAADQSYVTFLVDDEPLPKPMPKAPLPPVALSRDYAPAPALIGALTASGPAARSTMRVPGARKLAGPGAPMTAPGWTVAGTSDLEPAPATHPLAFSGPVSHARAAQTLSSYESAHPAAAGRWQVVEYHEAAAA